MADVTDCFLEGLGWDQPAWAWLIKATPSLVSWMCHHCALNANPTCDVAGLALFTKGLGAGLLKLGSDIWLLWYNFYFLYLYCLFSLAHLLVPICRGVRHGLLRLDIWLLWDLCYLFSLAQLLVPTCTEMGAGLLTLDIWLFWDDFYFCNSAASFLLPNYWCWNVTK